MTAQARLRPPYRRIGLYASACMLLACAHPAHRQAPVAITLTVAAIGADEAYLMGRQHQLARASPDALRLYRQALSANPAHVHARNGLASVLAEQGDFSGAIAIWQSMTAQLGNGADRSNAYLFSNLGYAYFLNGQYAEAQQAQQRACLLDPADALAWQRLGSTLAQAGDAIRAVRMLQQAQALLTHDVHADAALAGTVQAQSLLVEGADGLLTLQRTGSAMPAMSTMPAGPVTRRVSLEISNGNGVPGLARLIAGRLGTTALHMVRLNNEPGFGVQRTRIEFQADFHAVAVHLAEQVQADAVLVEAPATLRTNLRLVLGRNAGAPG